MRVQVILERKLPLRDEDASAMVAALGAAGLQLPKDQPLLSRFGILRGDVEPSRLEELRRVPGVKAVEPVGQKQAL